ncbi:MAG: nucleoside-diphosphate kinase [Planctomycetes bacterium]|nr:nucleoside-diphosphate kinase [Planctomycetota bacterium]
MDRTLVLVKPDGVERRLVGRILARIEDKGLRLAALKGLRMSQEQAKRLYAPHEGKGFYAKLVRFMTSGPIVAMVWEGPKASAICRKLMGATFGPNAEPGTIRGDFGISKSFNLVHGSDSPESADREIPVFFGKEEILEHVACDQAWLHDGDEDLR